MISMFYYIPAGLSPGCNVHGGIGASDGDQKEPMTRVDAIFKKNY